MHNNSEGSIGQPWAPGTVGHSSVEDIVAEQASPTEKPYAGRHYQPGAEVLAGKTAVDGAKAVDMGTYKSAMEFH